MSVVNRVFDYATGKAAAELEALYNQYGAQGWQLVDVDMTAQAQRRASLIQTGSVIEYRVIDYATGQPPGVLEGDLNGYGVDGFGLVVVDMHQQQSRRAIMMRPYGGGGGTGGIPEAPQDGTTYGRNTAAWDATFDGGSF